MVKKGKFHPSSLTTTALYAHGSAGERVIHAAQGVLATGYHIYTGGRQAEAFGGY